MSGQRFFRKHKKNIIVCQYWDGEGSGNNSARNTNISSACMRQWIGSALVQIIACGLFGATPLSKQMLGCCQLDPRNRVQSNIHQNTKLYTHYNAYENIVCEMAVILSRPQCVKSVTTNHIHDGHRTITSSRPWDAYMHKELALVGLGNSVSLGHHQAITWSKCWINVNWTHRN